MLWTFVNPSTAGNLRGNDSSADAMASCHHGSAEKRNCF